MKKLKVEQKATTENPKSILKNLTKRKIGYGAASAVVVTVFSYLASQILGAIFIGFWVGINGDDVSKVFENIENNTGLQFAFFLLVEAITLFILWVFLKSRGNSWKDIGMARKPALKDISPALITFAVYFVFLVAITAILRYLVPNIDTDQEQQLGFKGADTAVKLTMVFISLVVLPPIVEEIVVRGFLYSGLSKNFKRTVAAVITSALFAIAHLQLGSGEPPLWIAAVDTFVLSMFLIRLREKTGALWSGMLVHAIKNGLAFLFLFVIEIPVV